MSRAQFRKLMQEDPEGVVETLIFFQEKLRLAEEALEFYEEHEHTRDIDGSVRTTTHVMYSGLGKARSALEKLRGTQSPSDKRGEK